MINLPVRTIALANGEVLTPDDGTEEVDVNPQHVSMLLEGSTDEGCVALLSNGCLLFIAKSRFSVSMLLTSAGV